MMLKMPKPVKRPESTGAGQGVVPVWPVQPNQKSPPCRRERISKIGFVGTALGKGVGSGKERKGGKKGRTGEKDSADHGDG
jgi:hypothetical protein